MHGWPFKGPCLLHACLLSSVVAHLANESEEQTHTLARTALSSKAVLETRSSNAPAERPLSSWGADSDAGQHQIGTLKLLLAQMGLGAAHASKLGLETHATMMLTGLLGVPVLTAAVAFIVVEVSTSKPDDGDDPFRPRRTPRLGQGGRSQATPRNSAQSAYSEHGLYAVHQHPTSHNLHTGASLSGPPSRLTNGAPPVSSASSSVLRAPNGRVPNGFADRVMWSPRASSRLHCPTPSLGAASEDNGGSPLMLALLVRHSSGTVVKFDGTLQPHPEARTVRILSIRDSEAMLLAHVAETSANPTIYVEAADATPIAVLDTSQAIYHAGAPRPPPEHRRVVLHHTIGEDRAATGPACAWVSPIKGGTSFFVRYASSLGPPLGDSGDLALTVQTGNNGNGARTEHMINVSGQVVSETRSVGGGHKAIWVKQGFDMAFVACVSLAIQKLS